MSIPPVDEVLAACAVIGLSRTGQAANQPFAGTRRKCKDLPMSEPDSPLALDQINIVVRDMQRSLAFYRLLGVSIEDTRGPEWAEWARHHVNGVASNGVRVEFDSVAFAKQWNPGLDEARLGSAVIPMFHVSSREEVDRVHARVTAAGHRTHKAPEDAFWGARYAIVEDPDGNSVGVMSPIEGSKRRPPPPPPRT